MASAGPRLTTADDAEPARQREVQLAEADLVAERRAAVDRQRGRSRPAIQAVSSGSTSVGASMDANG